MSRWSARSAARTNDLDDGAERFSASSVDVESISIGYVVVCNVSTVIRITWKGKYPHRSGQPGRQGRTVAANASKAATSIPGVHTVG